MRTLGSIATLWLAAMAFDVAAADTSTPLPAWAYVVDPTPDVIPPPGGRLMHVPNSKAGYTLAQIANLFSVPDWHPESHPPMPPVVARGRKPDVYACGYCHLPNGLGRPENASLAGLPANYIVQQIGAFKSGNRKVAAPNRGPIIAMEQIAHALTPAETKSAAGYFSTLKRTPWIRVVESATAPKTKIEAWMLTPAPGNEVEPIGQRIIEVPESAERMLLRDDASGFVAYVPPGSLERGKAIALTGGGKTTACVACHGPDLRGLADFPGLAGRSPSYLARQLIDMKRGFRSGPTVAFMAPVVSQLSDNDIVDVVAYAASLAP